MKLLSIAGTIAMFLVGGGILVHGIGPLHHLVQDLTAAAGEVAPLGGLLASLTEMGLNAATGARAASRPAASTRRPAGEGDRGRDPQPSCPPG